MIAPIGIMFTVALLPNLRAVFVSVGATPTIMPVALEYAATILFRYTTMLVNIVNGFVGWGARDLARVLKAAKFLLSMVVALSIAYSVPVVVFARPLVRLLGDSE
ncbi:hypothetical protein [Bradyrhizobium sp. STM 3562]|uniref:hypothetical protein n=1 Tax=Bradyrhizobium sp. STM 3562 TaxID=578924 RepID=UPI00388FD908